MKNINLKKIMYAVLGATLGLALFISLSGDVTATSTSSGFQAFQMAKEGGRPDLSFTQSVLYDGAEKAIFRLAGTSVFENMLSFGQTRFHKLAIGYPDQNVPGTELSVDGTITIKELADPSRGDALVPACVDDFGVIVLCAADEFSCTNIPADAEICTGDDSDLFVNVESTLVGTCGTPAMLTKCEYTCSNNFHLDNGACVADVASVNGVCGNSVTNNQCSAGTYDASPADSATHYLWSCLGSNGGSDATNCQEVIPASPINGSCNNATQNGCTAGLGNDLAISDTTTLWRWRCDGVNGGSNSGTCKKYKPVNGVCNNATQNSCLSGLGDDGAIADTSTYYRWRCDGENGGSNSGTCQILKSGLGGGGCFVADTLVIMADGTSKNIQDIEIGEMVLGYNNEISEVKGLHRPLLGEGQSNELYSFNGGRYFVNTDHPFMTTHGWKAINPVESMDVHGMNSVTKLEIGDILITEKGSIVLETLDSIEGDSETQLYNLMLDGNHTYYADGYSVHNKKKPAVVAP